MVLTNFENSCWSHDHEMTQYDMSTGRRMVDMFSVKNVVINSHPEQEQQQQQYTNANPLMEPRTPHVSLTDLRTEPIDSSQNIDDGLSSLPDHTSYVPMNTNPNPMNIRACKRQSHSIDEAPIFEKRIRMQQTDDMQMDEDDTNTANNIYNHNEFSKIVTDASSTSDSTFASSSNNILSTGGPVNYIYSNAIYQNSMNSHMI